MHCRQMKNRAGAPNVSGLDNLAGNEEYRHDGSSDDRQGFGITHHLEEVAGDGWSSRSGELLSLFDDGSAAGTGDLEVSGVVCFFALAPQALSEP